MSSCYLAIRLNRSDKLPAGLASRVERVVPFEPSVRLSVERRGLWLFGFLRDEGLWPEPRHHEDPSGAAVISGYATGGDRGLLGAAECLRTPDLATLRSRFHGEWSMCTLTDEGIFATSDQAGTERVYVAEHPEFVAVSNRARLIWEVMKAFGARPEPDLEALAGLLSPGYIVCTNATAVRGVQTVDGTMGVRVPPTAGAAIEITNFPEVAELPENPRPDWDTLAERLCSNYRWIAGTKATIGAALTGGKDTRLVLAAMKSLGLEGRVDYYVSAPPEHADSLVAKQIADKLGLRFTRVEPPPRTRLLEDLRRHVVLTDGGLTAWDMTGAVRYRSLLGLHGLFGELYRSRGAAHPDPRKATRYWFSSPNLGSILRPEVFDATFARAAAWMQRKLDAGRTPEHLHELYYVRQYLHQWAGHTRKGDGLTGLQLNLLYHPEIQRAYGALPREDRTSDRVHFELISRLCPELVGFPFANSSWKPEMVARSTNPRAPITTEPTRNLRRLFGTGWQEPALVKQWSQVRERLMQARSVLEPIVDPKRLATFLDAAEFGLEVPTSKVRRTRAFLSAPILAVRAQALRHRVIRILLALLPIVDLEEELRAESPTIVRID